MGNVFCSYIFDNRLTRLREAIENCDEKTVKDLVIRNGELLNQECDKYGNTPLIYAILSAKVNMCKLLLELGANPNYQNSKTYLTPVLSVCALKTLKESFSVYNVNNSNNNSTNGNNNNDSSKFLPPMFTNLHRQLTEKLSNQSTTPITSSAAQTSPVTRTLSTSNQNSSQDNMISHHIANASADVIHDLIKCLKNFGADLNKLVEIEQQTTNGVIKKPVTPLMYAIDRRNMAAIEALLQAGADVNYQDPESHICALHLACGLGSTILIKKLLEHGADPFLKSKGDNTTLHWLAYNLKDDTGGLLLLFEYSKNLIDLNIPNDCGQTPLMLAVMRNKQNMVKTLLDNEAMTDVKDKYGLNAINYAVSNSCVNLLTSFHEVKKLRLKKQLSKLENTSTTTRSLPILNMSLTSLNANPMCSRETLATIEEDFAKTVVEENRINNEKQLRN